MLLVLPHVAIPEIIDTYYCHIYYRKAVNGKQTILGNCITFDSLYVNFLHPSPVEGCKKADIEGVP